MPFHGLSDSKLDVRFKVTEDDGFMEDFYVRDRLSICYELNSLDELLKQFMSDDGYRISFRVGDKIVWLWRDPKPLSEDSKPWLQLVD